MAGSADGGVSLSMSGREELMALKQTGCYSLFLSVCLYVSNTTHTLYSLFAGTKLKFAGIQLLERYKTIVSCDRPHITITEETLFRLTQTHTHTVSLSFLHHPLRPSVYVFCHWLEFNLRTFQFSCLRKPVRCERRDGVRCRKVVLLDWRGYDEITDRARQGSAFEIHKSWKIHIH